jgi:hypothetical protein
MSNKSTKKKLMLVIAAVGLLLAALAVRSGNYAQAQDAKKPTLKDALTRVAPHTIRANTGFILEKTGEREITVRRATNRVVVGKVGCSICPGGKCQSIIKDGQGTCSGCGKTTGSDCTYDPF